MSEHRQCPSRNARTAPAAPAFVLGALVFVAFAGFDGAKALSSNITAGTKTSAAFEPQFSKPLTTRLNQTGRVLTLPMPLKDDASTLGDVIVRISADDRISIALADLIDRTRRTLDDATRAQLAQLDAQNGFAPIETIVAAGVPIRFDPGLQELRIEPAVDQRQTSDISVAPRYIPQLSSSLARPAIWSGYLNVIAGLDHDWGANSGGSTAAQDGATSGRLELEGALRLYDVVIENRALYDGAVDAFSCPVEATCDYRHRSGLKRESTRLVYDLPASHIRVQVGDTTAIGTALQRSVDTLGLSIEKSAQKLAPGSTRVASARTSLRIDRPSEVDVMVNGVTLQRLTLRPGTYNIRDLPLATGANIIDLAITDDTGARRVETVTTFAASSMLAPGAFEWSAAAGLQSYLRDNQRTYDDYDSLIATGLARYGLSETVTVEGHVQGDRTAQMAGAGLVAETSWGVFGLGAALSASEPGAGYAGDVFWDLTNYRGLLPVRSESLRLSAEYRSPDFHRPGFPASAGSGVFYPEYDYRLRFAGSFSVGLDDGTSATLSARYQFSDEEIDGLSPFALNGDRYGADLTLARALTPSISGSLLAGYSNESYLHFANNETPNDGAFRAMVRLHIRPDDHTTVNAGYDTLDRLATVSGYRTHGEGAGRWDAAIDVQNFDVTERTAAGGSLSYTGNRAELRVSHHADIAGTDLAQSKTGGVQRTSLRAGSSIAFADGVVGIGAPVRGNAFALVHPHPSLAGRAIAAGSFDAARGYADDYGPAVVGDLPAYSPSSIPIDVADLPVGYSLGAGAFDLNPPYRAGYALEVGSASSVSVYGTLLNADGTPVELASGFAQPRGGRAAVGADARATRIAVFTNAKGRFGAEGLAPGPWVVEVDDGTRPLRFEFTVPPGADGLHRTGDLKPSNGDAK